MFPGQGRHTYGHSQQQQGGSYGDRPPQQGYGGPQGGYGGPQGGYGGPQGGYGAPQGGYGAPQGGYGAPQGGYDRPSGPPPGQSYGHNEGRHDDRRHESRYNDNEQGRYSRPSGPPPGQHSYDDNRRHDGGRNDDRYDGSSGGYSRPSGPPPGQDNYSRPSGAPPSQGGSYSQGGYSRPSGPPPGQDSYSRPSGPPSGQGSYSRPSEAPPSGSGRQSGGRGHYTQPSSQPQSFGVGNYTYQYSQCSGKKKALFVGINYIGTKQELKGCINDCENVKQFLLTQGFKAEDMVMLNDKQTSQRAIPTKQNILDAIGWLVKDAKPNDSLFFHYSGHGGQTPDLDGDEEDGYDEVIYPLDFETNGFIVDDQLHDLLVKTLPQGVRLTAIFDSCHSGSVLDLPYMYSTKGVVKEPNVLQEAGEGLMEAAMAYSKGDTGAMIKGVTGLVKSFLNKDKAEKAYEKTKQTKTAPADVISMSGCKDDQTSADAKEDGQSTGAMSYAFMTVMRQNPDQSYLSLLQNMREVLSSKYSQKPQLSASHPIDVNLQFIV
ncbi:casA [[Candida] subhashii]|uniref:CasA n=1 Tax=[Candida] subhashii TaxID=561895 RepID=A0A8J5QF33_9ASCO|nr:casA [[Candida] subhashii]KAG7660510.1 casA [[Candida] subhashii]